MKARGDLCGIQAYRVDGEAQSRLRRAHGTNNMYHCCCNAMH